MKKASKMAIYIMMVFLSVGSFAFAQGDAKGCKDHPLFSRMQGYRIVICEEKEFDAVDFLDPETKQKVTIEGRKFHTEYMTNKPFEGKYSRLQVSRNYTNAITKIGAPHTRKIPKTHQKHP